MAVPFCVIINPSPTTQSRHTTCVERFIGLSGLESLYADMKWIADIELLPTDADSSQITVLGRQR